MKKRHLKIIEPVFRSAVDIFVGYKFEEVQKWINKRQHESEKPIDDFHRFSDGVAFTIKGKTGRTHEILWFSNSKSIGTLIHEVNHLIFRIFTEKQIPIREENDEVFCYLSEYYVKEILKKFNQ